MSSSSSEYEASGHDFIREALLKHRRGEFDPKLDASNSTLKSKALGLTSGYFFEDALRKRGREILDSYDPKKFKRSRINPHSIFWMVSSMAVFYFTDFYVAIRIDPRVDWAWLYSGIAFLSTTLLIAITCIVWYHYIQGVSDYDKQFPYLVPMATVCFIAGMAW
eukprot:gene5670-6366_t